jgi:hypothetical protein
MSQSHFKKAPPRSLLQKLKAVVNGSSILRWNKTNFYHRFHKARALKKISKKFAYQDLGKAWGKIQSFKKSDTLFVFGCGTSLLTYTSKDWEHVARHDILLVNDALLAPVDPTFYLVETGCRDSLINNIYVKREKLEKSAILYRADDVFPFFRKQIPHSLKPHVYLYSALVPGYRSEMELREYYLQLVKHKPMSSWAKQGIVADSYGSIIRAVHLGICLNYKKVILCGVDLSTGEYFFDKMKEQLATQGLMTPNNTLVNQGQVHNTVNKSIRTVTADMVLYALSEVLAPSMGMEIYTYRDSSLLHPRIPLYKPENGIA